jgi:transcriptional regulator with XRE-family HTH domain
MNITSELTDEAALREIGVRLERRRIDAELTQAELAEEAGISKRTVERIEAGRSTDFSKLLRVLRVLQLLDVLEKLLPDVSQSPLALLKSKGRERKRVGHSRRKKNENTRNSTNTDPSSAAERSPAWKWRE